MTVLTAQRTLRDELHSYIDDLDDGVLSDGRNLLNGWRADNLDVVIETDLTAEEKAIIRHGRKEYREHPENFVVREI
ncbi:hypothetical protein AGMMS49959_04030 [Planctomycetales bacterium]|nr:hypothetical protein AGMMS49959_04030 [Planctomycetales bacterium]